jgi:arylsulfatase A-like enzyme
MVLTSKCGPRVEPRRSEAKGTTWEGGVRIPCIIRWPGKVQAGTQNSGIMSLEDLFTTLSSIAGEPDVAEKLKKGATYNGKQFKVLLEWVDQTDLITGKGPSKRDDYFYYDETNLTGIRYQQYKLLFSSKRNGKWDDELQPYRRALLVNLLMDPYELRTDDDTTRRLAEHKGWVCRPILDLMEKHLASFKEFPPRQTPMSGDFTKTIEGMMRQLKSGSK